MTTNLTDKEGYNVGSIAVSGNETQGVWLTLHASDGTQPAVCVVNNEAQGFFVGLYRDTLKPKPGCDVAISFGDKGPMLQVCRGNGPDDVVIVDLFDLLFANRFVSAEKKDA